MDDRSLSISDWHAAADGTLPVCARVRLCGPAAGHAHTELQCDHKWCSNHLIDNKLITDHRSITSLRLKIRTSSLPVRVQVARPLPPGNGQLFFFFSLRHLLLRHGVGDVTAHGTAVGAFKCLFTWNPVKNVSSCLCGRRGQITWCPQIDQFDADLSEMISNFVVF